MEGRTCGPCQACCRAKQIPALQLPAWTDCPHQRPAGCGIYAERPEGCRRYTCAWVDGWGEADDRPDLLGVLFEMAPGPFSGLQVRGIELKPAAADGPRARQRIEAWAELGARVRVLRQGEVA